MSEEKKYFTRLGDGYGIWMTEEEIREDIEAGVADAVKRGKVPPLSEEEKQRLFEIITMEGIIVSVKQGDQVVLSTDHGSATLEREAAVPITKEVQTQLLERSFGHDSTDFGFTEYSYKAIKSIVSYEAARVNRALDGSIIPVLYGAMPNLGFYTKPDGPVENWAELLPQGKIKEAFKAQEEAVEHAVHDIVFVADAMYDAGTDGVNMDTAGASGDCDFQAALLACEEIKKRHPGPEFGVEIGMAGEFVLGMHGRLKYKGERLAGMYAHDQVRMAEAAGASIFGAVVNTNTSMTFPWNIARVVTFIKQCVKNANKIAVHANVGMGVGGIPMSEVLAPDIVSRADKALIEIAKIDGL